MPNNHHSLLPLQLHYHWLHPCHQVLTSPSLDTILGLFYLIAFTIGISGEKNSWITQHLRFNTTCRKTCLCLYFAALWETCDEAQLNQVSCTKAIINYNHNYNTPWENLANVFLNLSFISSMVKPEHSPASISFKVFHLQIKICIYWSQKYPTYLSCLPLICWAVSTVRLNQEVHTTREGSLSSIQNNNGLYLWSI